MRRADAAGDTAAARRLAQMYKAAKAQAPAASSAPAPSTPRLGPAASAAVRPLVEGLGGIATMIPDMATTGGNALGNLIEKIGVAAGAPKGFMGPDVESPGQALQTLLDKYTTKPQGAGKVAEIISSLLAGGASGPKAQTVREIEPVIERLTKEGVTLTPGQRRGGMFNTLEEKAGALLPPVKNARARAVQQWNAARLNEARRSAGLPPVPKGLTGRDAINDTKQALSQRYSEVLGKMGMDLHRPIEKQPTLPAVKGQVIPSSFLGDIEKLRKLARGLDRPQRRALNHLLNNQVIKKFTKAGKASGDTVKEISEVLRTEADSLKSGSPQDRKLAMALQQVQADLRKHLKFQNPASRDDLERLDRGYAQYKLSEKASVASKAGEGGYTPAQRLQAAYNRDKSKDKSAFARGAAAGQREAQEAQGILGNTQPDSGTPFGSALTSLAVGGPAAAMAHPGLATGLAATPLLYSEPVLRLLQQQAVSPTRELPLGAFGALQQSLQPDSLGVVNGK